jgi:hypothetical protein
MTRRSPAARNSHFGSVAFRIGPRKIQIRLWISAWRRPDEEAEARRQRTGWDGTGGTRPLSHPTAAGRAAGVVDCCLACVPIFQSKAAFSGAIAVGMARLGGFDPEIPVQTERVVGALDEGSFTNQRNVRKRSFEEVPDDIMPLWAGGLIRGKGRGLARQRLDQGLFCGAGPRGRRATLARCAMWSQKPAQGRRGRGQFCVRIRKSAYHALIRGA